MNVVTIGTWLPTRARKVDPTTVVLHATVGATALSSIAWLRKISLSYHYVIERDGTIYKCAPTGRVAFHCGASVGPDGSNVNNYSIGIAFANKDDGKDLYTVAQVEACNELLDSLALAMPSLKYVTTHARISPGRKTDPKYLSLSRIKLPKSLLWW